jgi:hypothetical protein
VSTQVEVVLNRDRLHSVDAPDSFTADEPFVVALANRGESVHVHLHLDDALSRVAELAGGNHYVEAGGRREVQVRVDPPSEAVRGKLKVVTGYGAETTYVDVTIEPAAEPKEPVAVDEELAKPQSSAKPPGVGERIRESLPAGTNLPVLGVGVAAVALAIVVALTIESPVVLLGVGIVVGGVVAALAFSLR